MLQLTNFDCRGIAEHLVRTNRRRRRRPYDAVARPTCTVGVGRENVVRVVAVRSPTVGRNRRVAGVIKTRWTIVVVVVVVVVIIYFDVDATAVLDKARIHTHTHTHTPV